MPDLIKRAVDIGLKGIALTDHEALCGHIEWMNLERSMKKDGKIPEDFKCALGNEIYLTETREPAQKYYHLILIAKDKDGHHQLRELSSIAWLNSYRYHGIERVPTLKSDLERIVKENPNHLICSSACLGSEFSNLVITLCDAEEAEDMELALAYKAKIDKLVRWFISLFGDDYYIECAPGDSKDQVRYNKRIASIAKAYDRKIVIGTDAHFLREEDRQIHKAFLNSKEGDREVDAFYKNAYLMDNDKIFELLGLAFEEEAIEKMFKNSVEIYDKIEHFSLEHAPIIPQVKVPEVAAREASELESYPIMRGLVKNGNAQERYWANECLTKLKEKGLYSEEYLGRLETEADVIKYLGDKMGNCLFEYFNTFQHYIDLFWECGCVVGPGRGSSTGFLSNYLMGITQMDPIKWKLPWFRFLNKERVELPDIDVDLSPSKRPLVLKRIREERGELNVVQVATFGVEAPKSAIAAAARGYRSVDCPNGIDVDVARYMASLIPVERGFVRPIKDCLYGNEEKGWKPITELIRQFDQYPGFVDVVVGIEGVICRRGQHASGVILYNNNPFDTGALMRSPNGDITTQFDLHRAEECGDVKYDYLVTDIADKLSVFIDLLMKDGYFSECENKRAVYDKYFHPEKIDLKDNRLWDALIDGSVQDVFQFNTSIGQQTARSIKPHSLAEMSAANALLRLAAPEGQERPLDRYIKFKNNISLWYDEMAEAGLTKEEQKVLERYYLEDYGVPASQEGLMLMVMDKDVSGFSLGESNAARKVVAKKKLKEIPALKEKFISQCPSKAMGAYAWKTMMEPQMTYSFSKNHAYPYSMIGVQTLLAATSYPDVYWNCACLIVNAQSIEEEKEDEDEEISCVEESLTDEVDEDENEDEEEDAPKKKDKKKQKVRAYGRIATAIGRMREAGIEVAAPDINKSGYTFSPDAENKLIRYGISGISKVGDEVVKRIIENRPYKSLEDFTSRMSLSKPQTVNLIKSGTFDCFGERRDIMDEYVRSVSDQKKRVTLQNMSMLINFNLLPPELSLEVKIFNFNKYLKKHKVGDNYLIDEVAMRFYEQNFDVDKLIPYEENFVIKQIAWDKIYTGRMDKVRDYLKAHTQELLDGMNNKLISDVWDKYCEGSYSKWEMDSVSFYSHEHELAGVISDYYGFVNWKDIPEEPVIEKVINIKGKQIPMYRINRIIGTVVDKDKMRKTITVLTVDGSVITAKLFGPVYSFYDKQISEVGADGKKHVKEPSCFKRGRKLILSGIRTSENEFLCKKYKSNNFHLVEMIDEVFDDGTISVSTREMEG